MTVVFPYVRAATWVDGVTDDDSAKRNTIEDGIFNAHQQPGVHAYNSTTQAVANAVDTVVNFDSEYFDTAGGAASTMHDLVTNPSRLTCRYAGTYMAVAHVNFATAGTGNRFIWLRKNGTVRNAQILSAAATQSAFTFAIMVLAVNDYLEVLVNQNSGGSINLSAEVPGTGEGLCDFAMFRVG